MNEVTLITHFSAPNWPLVNKLRTITKCLDVPMIHCSKMEILNQTLSGPLPERCLFFTDEGLIDLVQDLSSRTMTTRLEVALWMVSPIAQVAEKIGSLKNVKYLIGMEEVEAQGRDLSILIKKFADGNILDLDKYLAFGSKINRRVIDSNKAKRAAIEAVSIYVSRLGDPGYNHPFDDYARRVSALADELILNAIFHANPRLEGTDRALPFQLSDGEKVEMAWGYDGDYFGISVRDPFGKFNSETVMRYLSNWQTLKDIGNIKTGGLGVKLIFEKAHKVVTNVKSEKVTEVIALIKFAQRMTEFENQKKSFYFFSDLKINNG